jgi:uracil-DNA glycosylase family 4
MEAGDDILDIPSALSVLGWWRDAGVDTTVADSPRNWLAEPMGGAPAPVAPKPAAVERPATLAALRAWMESAPALPDGSLPGRRLLAEGDPASNLMILIDMPEPADGAAGRLLSDDTGRLLDRMLAAIGRDRGSIYLASLCLARPAGGRIDPAGLAAIADIARQHVTLAAPKRLLLMGQAVSRAILATELVEIRGELRIVNHGGVSVEAVASFAPRFLIQNPARKADAWRDLRVLTGGIGV